ncbi:MAG: hypothetical protein DRQ78_12770, partial [Epsilonproteobacteria bacterium]
CASEPYTPNLKELLAKMNMQNNYKGLYRFLEYLNRAKVFSIVRAKTKGDNIFTKPDKIYLNNTNLHFAYCATHNTGTSREVFFHSMLKVEHSLSIPKKGDFMVDDIYTFEIGGKNKSFKQIKDIPHSFVVLDDIEIGSGDKIPLWLFGFLY